MKNNTLPPVGADDAARLIAANDAAVGLVDTDIAPRLRDMPATTMVLDGVAKSEVAKAFIERLHVALLPIARERGRRQLKEASGAVLLDVLEAASFTPHRPLFRPMSSGSFKGQRIGYHPARAALEAFEGRGLISRVGGNLDRDDPDARGVATRFLFAPELLEELGHCGIYPANRYDHFQRVRTRRQLPPILCNTAKKRRGNRMPTGKPLPVDYSNPVVVAMAEQVQRISDFTWKGDLSAVCSSSASNVVSTSVTQQTSTTTKALGFGT